MELSRRAFFGSLAYATGGALLANTNLGAPNIKVGVISDIHVVPDRYKRRTREYFLKVLNLFKKENVDAVIIAGDMTDRGIMSEMTLVSESWYEVFPNDMNGDKKVEKIFVTGNHDAGGYRWMAKDDVTRQRWAKEGVDLDWNGNWKKLFREEYSPIFIKEVKGYTFVGAHWVKWYKGALDKFLEENKDKLNPSKPFFYVQHPHLKDTVFGSWAWGSWDDEGFARKALNKYPNAFAFSGHAHYPLTDERNVWQGEFTAVGTSSTSYTSKPWGRSNKKGSVLADRQAMVMSVWDDTVVLERWDIMRDEKLDEDWVIPVLHSSADKREFAFEERAKKVDVLDFPANVKIKQTLRNYKKGEKRSMDKGDVILSIPAVKALDWKKRVYDYEVIVESNVCDVKQIVSTKRFYQTNFNISPKRAVEDTICEYSLSELPCVKSRKQELCFLITPLNCFGKRGKTIRCPFNAIAPKVAKKEEKKKA